MSPIGKKVRIHFNPQTHLICRLNSLSVVRRIRNFQGSTFSLDFLHIWFLLLPLPANYPRTSEIESGHIVFQSLQLA
jgi:hypothetical protein